MSDLPAATSAAARLLAISSIVEVPDVAEGNDARGNAADDDIEPRASRGRRVSRASKRSTLSRMCKECGTTDTPSWRRGADGARTLCNACGLKFLREFRKEVRRKGDPEPAHLMLRPLAHPIPPKKRKSLSSAAAADESPTVTDGTAHDALQSSLELEADVASLPDVHQRLPAIADRSPDITRMLSSGPPHSAQRDEFTTAVAQSSSSTAVAKKLRPSVDFDFILNAGDDFANASTAPPPDDP
jgi:hypothetical protein